MAEFTKKDYSDYCYFKCPICHRDGFVNPSTQSIPNPPEALLKHIKEKHNKYQMTPCGLKPTMIFCIEEFQCDRAKSCISKWGDFSRGQKEKR